jgi:tetratricopeptide (TPR) repeat protein
MTVNDAKVGAEASENGSDDLTKVGSDLSDEIEDITIQEGKAGDSVIPSNMAPLGGVSVAAQRRDEYDINFDDTRGFAIFRLRDVLNSAGAILSPSDQKIASKYHGWHEVVTEIQGKLIDPSSTRDMKREMGRIQPFPRTLNTLTQAFESLVVPHPVKFDVLWGMVYLNLKLSYASPERLKRIGDLFSTVRAIMARFNKCLAACDDNNEALLAVVDFLDPIATILSDSIRYLHECSSEHAANLAWPDLNKAINTQLATLEDIVRHINEITSLSKVNQDRMIKNLSMKHAHIPESDEPGTFPNRIIPFRKNPKFYGRVDELEKIHEYLSPKDDQSLRTYTIYGRRGVGKTEIALQFAHENRAGFDAIFWIQCENSVAIRQSFTNAAVSLNLPGADRAGHHEENLLAMQNWLKKTSKKWLMIFDNAERDQVLKAYWPIGASGAILITSRKYYNFSKDLQRKGGTVKPFNSKESWDLLLQLLGDDWKKYEREGRIPQTEITAAKNLLEELEGLALAIQQAAILIQDSTIGGPTIVKTYELFKEKVRTLPDRHRSVRSPSETALDALWDMSFKALSPHARTLLGVLAWLSPDNIQVELFLPRTQKALDIALSFCRQDPVHLDENERASIFSIITPSEAFEKAMNQLLDRKLIKQDGRMYTVHRVVQEAVSYHDVDELQKSFAQAARLVYEQFPKQGIATMYKDWKVCQVYIPHGVHLSKKFSDYVRSGALSATDAFVSLLGNCAYYLREIADFDVCSRVIETATSACVDKTSLLYARLMLISGNIAYDLNRLTECRNAWDITMRIRLNKLAHDDPAVASIYNNMGNLETAQGNLQESRNYFDRAVQIWADGGDATATTLAFTYLSAGRMHMLQGNLTEAMNLTLIAESIIIRTFGADKGIMANIQYAYGNIEFLQRHLTLAWRAYDQCRQIAVTETPIHPITAAAYYSLACVEFEMGHPEPAKMYLDKARSIAELRSPTRDDGVIARICWKTAIVLESDTFGSFKTEAGEFRNRAELARQKLLASGEGGIIPFIENDANRDEEEDRFDALVPLFYR